MARSNDVAGEYHTRSGKVGLIIYRHVRKNGGEYDYEGAWGAGSGHSEASVHNLVTRLIEQKKGVQVIIPFNSARGLRETARDVAEEHQEMHDMDFTKDDLKIFRAFLNQTPAEGRRFRTDGQRLDGGMYLSRVASWEGGHVETHDLGSRTAQQIHRKLRKMGGGIVRESATHMVADFNTTADLAKGIAYRSSGNEEALLKALAGAGAVVIKAYPEPNFARAQDERRKLLQIHARFPDGTAGFFSPGGPPRVWNYVFFAGSTPGDEALPGVPPDQIASVVTRGREMRETSHVVADFNTLHDLISHAARDLGATHVSGSDAGTKIYFPRGGQHPYEEATVWRKNGYWHAQGPGARTGVEALPSGAKPIARVGVRRAAEDRRRGRRATEAGSSGFEKGDRIMWSDSFLRRGKEIDPQWFALRKNERGTVDWIQRDGDVIVQWDNEHNTTVHPPERLAHATGRALEEYMAIDHRDRPIAGPFEHQSDARDAAGPGGHVKFIPSGRRASEATRAQPEIIPDPMGTKGYVIQRIVNGAGEFWTPAGWIGWPPSIWYGQGPTGGRFESESAATHALRTNGLAPSGGRASEARRGPRVDPRAVAFFRANAATVVGREDEYARDLAHAEQEATARGWSVEWEHDPDGMDSLGDIDPDDVQEILVAVLKDEDGEVLGSLGSVVNPDRAYGRVIEAELALDALSEEKK